MNEEEKNILANPSIPPWPGNGARPLNAAIVGGGKGCVSILKMVEGDELGRFRMRVLGVADPDQNAQGIRYAIESKVPVVTSDYHELYKIPDLDFIIELTGLYEVRDEIERSRPRNLRLIDHFAARLFWELHQSEEAVIRQRTEMREQVEAERERIAQILDSIPDEIVVIDNEMVIRDVNSNFLRNNKLAIDDVRGSHCYDIDQHIRGECQVAVENCPFSTVMKDRKPTSLVRKHFNEEGQTLYASIVGAPLVDRNGNVVGMIEMTRDITTRIQLEQALSASEVRLQQYVERAPLAIYVKNRAGQYIDVNPAACSMFGKEKTDIIGKTDLEIFDREAAEKMRSGDRQLWHERNSVSEDFEVEFGSQRVFLSTVKFLILEESGDPTALCGFSIDITAQKEAENKLNETSDYLQQMLDNSPVIIITTDMDTKIVSFNAGAEKCLGYKASEVIGQPAALFYRDPSKREDLMRMVKSGNAVRDYSYELLKKDGTLLPVSITLSQLKDASGKMIGTVGMSKDISHRKELMSQILQTERMAAVGRLGSGVAHEINNPLAVIAEVAGYLNDMVELGLDADKVNLVDELKEGLPKIINQVKRGREITRRLLSFARKTEARVDMADVNASLDEILPFLEKEARFAQTIIHRDYQPDLPRAAVEEMQLQEVFINLITNALHALANQASGNIWLKTRLEKGKVIISIRDDGPGIDDSVRDRLFDPFVTTKPTGKGTGLGLSICYSIVKRYDGEIRVVSEPGQGTTFRVILPTQNPSQIPTESVAEE
ncbi:MAG: PAS domain S-box protein [Deltaproteobacteria bacterium]|nr:PAS domain S-box protein [Deltaproteobacteria bacterium]